MTSLSNFSDFTESVNVDDMQHQVSYDAGNKFLELDVEEHEMLNTAIIHLLDAAEEMTDGEDTPRVKLLRQLRGKSIQLWMERFNNV